MCKKCVVLGAGGCRVVIGCQLLGGMVISYGLLVIGLGLITNNK